MAGAFLLAHHSAPMPDGSARWLQLGPVLIGWEGPYGEPMPASSTGSLPTCAARWPDRSGQMTLEPSPRRHVELLEACPSPCVGF